MVNQAAIDGPQAFPWWLDWRGECVAIIASGPSTKKAPIAELRNRINVLAIKVTVDLCPWANAVYGCDAAWWNSRRGLPWFKGLKLTFDANGAGIQKISIDRNHDGILTEQPGRIGSGGNSGFQALNIAVQFGATGILLIGFDMRSEGNSPHYYGHNDWPGSSNPTVDNYSRWRRAFEASADTLKQLRVDVVNASDKSALKCFRHASIDEALRGWGL